MSLDILNLNLYFSLWGTVFRNKIPVSKILLMGYPLGSQGSTICVKCSLWQWAPSLLLHEAEVDTAHEFPEKMFTGHGGLELDDL